MAEILYTTVDREHCFELEEKRSIFIGYVRSVKTEQEAKDFIASIKAKHHDARHNCSAFLLRNGVMRYSDDGEPQGTAGVPILEVIKKSGLVDVVVVVTRYFGGILLGAGGLVRAYSAAASGVLTEAPRASYQECTEFSVVLQYPHFDKLSRLISRFGARVVNTEYGENITLTGVIVEEDFNSFCTELINAFGGKITANTIRTIIEKV